MVRKYLIFFPLFVPLAICSFLTIGTVFNQFQPSKPEDPWITGTAEVPGDAGIVEETLVVPVNTTDPVLTTHHYAGYVTITVHGEGQIDSETKHDAIMKYKANEPRTMFYGFTIDERGLFPGILAEKPPRLAEHKYHFLYWAGTTLHPIGFRILNGNEQDPSEFTIEVSTVNKVIPPVGR